MVLYVVACPPGSPSLVWRDAATSNEERGATISVFELPGSLRLPHDIVDPARGPALDEAVLELPRQLAYGEPPSSLVSAVPLH